MTYNGMNLDEMTPKQRYYWKNRERLLEENKQRYYEKNKVSIEERKKIIEENKEKKRLIEQQKAEQKEQKKKLKEDLTKAIKDLEFLEAKEVVEQRFNTTFLEAIPNLSYNELESLFIKAACDYRAGELEKILHKKVMSMVNN